jgi:polysaccharide biosynthesis transport protein
MHDTPDRLGLPPSWPPAPLGDGLPKPAWDDPLEAGAPPARAITARTLWRAVRRHWWQILALWVVASAGLVALAYYKIKPSYESTAWLEVKPATRPILSSASITLDDSSALLDTQVQLIKSPDVLSAAANDEKVRGLPRFVGSLDPEAELRKELQVTPVPRTSLILVSMSSESPQEAYVIVETVVRHYLKSAESWTDRETRAHIDQLRVVKNKLGTDIIRQRQRLTGLMKKQVGDPMLNRQERDKITLEQYKTYVDQLKDLQIEQIKAKTALTMMEEMTKRRQQQQKKRSRPAAAGGQDELFRLFLADPEVRDLIAQMESTRDQMTRIDRLNREGRSDPVKSRLQANYAKLQDKYHKLWAAKRPALAATLAGDGEAKPDDDGGWADNLFQARLHVETLRVEEKALTERLEKLQIQTKDEGGEALEISFAKTDLDNSQTMLVAVEKHLQQLDFEQRGGARVSLAAAPRLPMMPSSNKRLLVMAAAPVGVLGLLLGLFVLIEARAARVADPDDLPARVRLGVLGVVPPLPTASPSRSPRALRDERRRVEEFVQSLDHLRVALCAGAPGATAGRRCVLITSACGGEGKTTLAAQLAGRCANAGLMTLLIDADLRRPSLGELLEVPEGPGLVDVLAGEVEPEAAMVVIGNAGGFHLLPAGTLGQDPSRLLQGDRLGGLIARLRATFDVVIIDAPPVLAVPDALQLGRWTDGAVLAVRHDTSRFPLVERAHRRLAAIGVPVLGAVVNGVRSMESSYGAYPYHYASASEEADRPAG